MVTLKLRKLQIQSLYNVVQWLSCLMCLIVLCQVDVLTKEQIMCFSQRQRCFIAKYYFLNQRSHTRIKIAFEEKWPKINLQKTLIHRVIISFEQQHTVADLLKRGPLRVQTMEFKQHVSTTLVSTPHAGCTLSPSAFGESLGWELPEMRLGKCNSLHSCRELSILVRNSRRQPGETRDPLTRASWSTKKVRS